MLKRTGPLVLPSMPVLVLSRLKLNQNGEARLYLENTGNRFIVASTFDGENYEAQVVTDSQGVPVISGADIEVIRIDATVRPIILQYYIIDDF